MGGIIIIQMALIIYIKRMRKNGSVVVPRYNGDIPKGTLNSILKQAGLK